MSYYWPFLSQGLQLSKDHQVISCEQPSTYTTLLLQVGNLMHNVINTHVYFKTSNDWPAEFQYITFHYIWLVVVETWDLSSQKECFRGRGSLYFSPTVGYVVKWFLSCFVLSVWPCWAIDPESAQGDVFLRNDWNAFMPFLCLSVCLF